jgi:hypothetical protein
VLVTHGFTDALARLLRERGLDAGVLPTRFVGEAAPDAPGADESRLMIALIHVRKLPDPAKARSALDALGRGLPEALRPLADTLRAELAA